MTNAEILQAVSFPVGLRQINYVDDRGESVQIPDRQAVVRTDTGEALSVVSNHYKLMPYREMTEPLLETIDKHGAVLPARTSGIRRDPIRVEAEGRRIWLEATFKNHEIKIGKDVIQPRLVYGNSYDGTTAYKAITGFYQVICTNAGALIKSGLIAGTGSSMISLKHKGRGDEFSFSHVEDHLKMFLDNFGLMSQTLSNLANTTVPIDRAKELLKQYCGERHLKSKGMMVDGEVVLQPESAYAFYARITNYLTLDYRGGQQPMERKASQALQDIIREAR